MSNTPNKAAVLVDYDLYRLSPQVKRWCEKRADQTTLVMLVSNPQNHDYDPEAPLHANGPEFPVVLRNSGELPDLVFKTSALCVIQDMSDLTPVVSLDASFSAQQMFRAGGVIVSLYEKDLHYDE